MEKKYRALRIISGIYAFMGVAILVFGTLEALLTTFPYSYGFNISRVSGFNIVAGLTLEVGVLVVGIGLLGVSQLVQLLIDVEENTRVSAESQSDEVKLLKMLVRQGQGGEWVSEKKS